MVQTTGKRLVSLADALPNLSAALGARITDDIDKATVAVSGEKNEDRIAAILWGGTAPPNKLFIRNRWIASQMGFWGATEIAWLKQVDADLALLRAALGDQTTANLFRKRLQDDNQARQAAAEIYVGARFVAMPEFKYLRAKVPTSNLGGHDFDFQATYENYTLNVDATWRKDNFPKVSAFDESTAQALGRLIPEDIRYAVQLKKNRLTDNEMNEVAGLITEAHNVARSSAPVAGHIRINGHSAWYENAAFKFVKHAVVDYIQVDRGTRCVFPPISSRPMVHPDFLGEIGANQAPDNQPNQAAVPESQNIRKRLDEKTVQLPAKGHNIIAIGTNRDVGEIHVTDALFGDSATRFTLGGSDISCKQIRAKNAWFTSRSAANISAVIWFWLGLDQPGRPLPFGLQTKAYIFRNPQADQPLPDGICQALAHVFSAGSAQ